MIIEATAVYSNGTLKLKNPLPLKEEEEVRVRIEPTKVEPEGERLTLAEFKAILDEMAEDVPSDTPPLPDDFSRADCYSDERG